MKLKKCTRTIAVILTISLLLCACGTTAETPAETTGNAPAENQTESKYSYALTPQQQENYQSADSYIVRIEDEDVYRVQYSKCGVTYADGKLSTNFNGMAVQLVDEEGAQFYPVLEFNGSQMPLNCIGTVSLITKQGEISGWRYLAQIEEGQETPTLVAMRLRENGTDEEMLAGGHREVPDASAYESAFFYHGPICQVVYDEEGRPLPVSQWKETGRLLANSVHLANELQASYVPFAGEGYYVLYEITDNQGNVYCSEMIPYGEDMSGQVEENPENVPENVPEKAPDVSVKWQKGAREQLFLEENGIGAYLSVEKDSFTGETQYALKVKNTTEKNIKAKINQILVNERISISLGDSVNVMPGKFTASPYGMSFEIAIGAPELEKMESMRFVLTVTDTESWETLINEKTVLVDMTDAWPLERKNADYFNLVEPAMDAKAQEQILLETGDLRITLLGAGKRESPLQEELTLVFRAENLSSVAQRVTLSGLAANDVFCRNYTETTLLPNSIGYFYGTLTEYDIRNATNNSIEKMSVLISTSDTGGRNEKDYWCPVTLSQAGKAEPFEKGALLWEKDGIQIGNRGYNAQEDCWGLTVSNIKQLLINVEILDAETNESLNFSTYVGPNQYAYIEIKPKDGQENRKIHLKITDANSYTLICEETQDIVLKAE